MNIIRREMRANSKSLVIWCLSMVLLIIVGMIKYQGFADMGAEANKLIESIPNAIKNALGLGSIDITQIGGYYSIFFMYFSLLGGIHAVMLGATIISKEQRDKTADFLMVKPIKRSVVVKNKIISAFINLLILNIITGVFSIGIVGVYNKGKSITPEIIKLTLVLLVVQCVFLGIGLVFSVLADSSKRATLYSTAVILGTYILSIAIGIYDRLKFLGFLSPFYYFDAQAIMNGRKVNFMYLVLAFTIIIIGVAYTFRAFERKDIHI